MKRTVLPTLLLLALVAGLDLACVSDHPDAEKRPIPKWLKITTDINLDSLGLYFQVTTHFITTSDVFPCSGPGGLGWMPKEQDDTYVLAAGNNILVVPLRCTTRTWCPYVIAAVYIEVFKNGWSRVLANYGIDANLAGVERSSELAKEVALDLSRLKNRYLALGGQSYRMPSPFSGDTVALHFRGMR
jgi:hypothetical protein